VFLSVSASRELRCLMLDHGPNILFQHITAAEDEDSDLDV